MEQIPKLKPCPFCGGVVRFNFNLEGVPDGVLCMKCRMFVRFFSVKPGGKHEQFYVVMDKIAEAWNRRATRDE